MRALSKISTAKDFFTVQTVEGFLTPGFDRITIAVLVERNKISYWAEAIANYPKSVDVITIQADGLELIYDRFGTITDIKDQKQLDIYLESNRLFTTTKILKNGNQVGEVKEELFISGKQNKITKIYNQASQVMQEKLIVISDQKFEIFNKQAYDKNEFSRMRDTEMQYIFNFLTNYYHLGDRFEITMESVLYACSNCRRYLEALINAAKVDEKTIVIEFRSHPEATTIIDAKKILKRK